MVAVRNTVHHKWENGDDRTDYTVVVPHTILRGCCGCNHKNDPGSRCIQNLGKQAFRLVVGYFYNNFLGALLGWKGACATLERKNGLFLKEQRGS